MQGVHTLINRLQEVGNALTVTSVIVAGELQFMAQNSQQRTANLVRVRTFLQRIDVYPIDLAIAQI